MTSRQKQWLDQVGSVLEFRIHEGVDTSYTKFNRKPDPIDDNPFNKVVSPADLLHVDWTEAGEWFNITLDVTHAGTYAADFLYTSNRGGTISVDVNGKDATGPLQITSANDPADPLAWQSLSQHRENALTVQISTLRE